MFLLVSIPSATSAMAVFMYDFIGKMEIKRTTLCITKRYDVTQLNTRPPLDESVLSKNVSSMN